MQIPHRYRINTSSFAYYWQQGIGVALLEKLPIQPQLQNADQYIPYLFQYDELGDKLVKALHLPLGFGQGQRIIGSYLQDPQMIAPEYRSLIESFFAPIDIEPSWLDWKLLRKGLDLSQRSGLSGLITLRDYCLMGGYESAAINKPLIYTGALKKGSVKRLSETVDFWVNITGDNALRYGNVGFDHLMKTRMIHSFARVNLLKATDWDSAKWGLPLNTWDMLATNLGFSLVYLVGIQRLGIRALPEEVNGLFHLWKYIGYLLGLPLEIIPENEEAAIEALYYWTMTQADGDADSKSLAHALQQEPVDAHYPTTKIGRKMMREIHLFYNHYLLGNYSCNLLQLDRTFWGKVAYLNVVKNKLAHRGISEESHRQKLIQKGRVTHERVKDIYLRYNTQ
ncbi:oxygenase MpaB family protein [Olivibacter ginsenosidimutans]|uniref:Oxygenase MpaB family protein n=1 Tax=Olivibacter ginsenosidimutans TaxID=1176537 RepID=A0ABP9AJH7_9SPHI